MSKFGHQYKYQVLYLDRIYFKGRISKEWYLSIYIYLYTLGSVNYNLVL